MKKFALKLVSVFEIMCGLGGIVMILGGILGILPYEAVPVLWFGIFPLLSLAAGIMLWLGSKYANQLSTLVLLLQIPFVYVSGYSLMRFGLAFNLYITATWNARAGVNATVLGINLLALGMLFILLWSKNDATENDQSNTIV
jgi:hypothetical protein